MTPWHSPWWSELVKCAERGGHSASEIIEEVSAGHAMGWPVDDGFLVITRSEDDAILVWLGVGRGVRTWNEKAERELLGLARSIGCTRLRIEGRPGWRRILSHWTQVGDRLELAA